MTQNLELESTLSNYDQRLKKNSYNILYNAEILSQTFSDILKVDDPDESEKYIKITEGITLKLGNLGKQHIINNKKEIEECLYDLVKPQADDLQYAYLDEFFIDKFRKVELPNYSKNLKVKIKNINLKEVPTEERTYQVVGNKRKRQKLQKGFKNIIYKKQDYFPEIVKVNTEIYDRKKGKNEINELMQTFLPLFKKFNELDKKVNILNDNYNKFRDNSIKEIISKSKERKEKIEKNIYNKLEVYINKMFYKRKKTQKKFIITEVNKMYKTLFDHYEEYIKILVNKTVLQQIQKNETINSFFTLKKEFSEKVKNIDYKIIEIDSKFAKFSTALRTEFNGLSIELGNDLIQNNNAFYNDYVDKYNKLTDDIEKIIKNQKKFNQRLESQESKISSLIKLNNNFKTEVIKQLKVFEIEEKGVSRSLQVVNNEIIAIKSDIEEIWKMLKTSSVKGKISTTVQPSKDLINTNNNIIISMKQYEHLLTEINELKLQIPNNTGYVNPDEVQIEIQNIRKQMESISKTIKSDLNNLYNGIKTEVLFNLKNQISNEMGSIEDNLFNQNRSFRESFLINKKLNNSISFNIGIEYFNKEFGEYKKGMNEKYINFFNLFTNKLEEYKKEEAEILNEKIKLEKKEKLSKTDEEKISDLELKFNRFKRKKNIDLKTFFITTESKLKKDLDVLSDKVEQHYNTEIEKRDEELKKFKSLLELERKEINEFIIKEEIILKKIGEMNKKIEDLKSKSKPENEVTKDNLTKERLLKVARKIITKNMASKKRSEIKQSKYDNLKKQIISMGILYKNLKKELVNFKNDFFKDINKNFLKKTFKNTKFMTSLFLDFMQRNTDFFNDLFDVMFKEKFKFFQERVNIQYINISKYYNDEIERNKENFKGEFNKILKDIKEKEIEDFTKKVSGFDKSVRDFEEKSILLSKNINEFNEIINILVKSEKDSEEKGINNKIQTNFITVGKNKEDMTKSSNEMIKGFLKLKTVIDVLYKSKDFKDIMKIRRDLSKNTEHYDDILKEMEKMEKNVLFNKSKYEELQMQSEKTKKKLVNIENYKKKMNNKFKKLRKKTVKEFDVKFNIIKNDLSKQINKGLKEIKMKEGYMGKLIIKIQKETESRFKIYDERISALENKIKKVSNDFKVEISERVKISDFKTEIARLITLIKEKEASHGNIKIEDDDQLLAELFKSFDPIVYITPYYGKSNRPNFFFADQNEEMPGCFNYSKAMLTKYSKGLLFEIDKAETYTEFIKIKKYRDKFYIKKQQLIITEVIGMTTETFLSDHLIRFENLVTLILKDLKNMKFKDPGYFFKKYITGDDSTVNPILKKLNYLQISLNNFDFISRESAAYHGDYYNKGPLTYLEICDVKPEDFKLKGKIHNSFYYIRGSISNIYISAYIKEISIDDNINKNVLKVINEIKWFDNLEVIKKFIIFRSDRDQNYTDYTEKFSRL